MSSKLILFAQKAEALPTIEALKATPALAKKRYVWSEGEQHSLYTFDNGFIAICGMGSLNALATTLSHIDKVDEVWNLGLAGALKKELPIGSVETIHIVGKLVYHPEPLDPISDQCLDALHLPLALADRGLHLMTSDFPLHNAALRQKLSQKWDLIDMEGYGVAYACQEKEKKCTLVKIVSDFATEGGRDYIRKHKKKLAHKLASLVKLGLY